MSRASRVLALAALLGARPLAAQTPERRSAGELRGLVARADSQLAVFAAAKARLERTTAPRRAARLVQSGDVAMVVWEAFPDSIAREAARRADSLLRASGAIPSEFIRGLVFVMPRATDTAAALAAAEMSSRRRAAIQLPEPEAVRGVDDWWVLSALLEEYAATQDSTWRAWTMNAWAFVRATPSSAAEQGGRELTAPRYAVTEQCLAGHARGCRLFLGLDADPQPYRTRFRAAELRAMVADWWGGYPSVIGCRGGDDAACVRTLERFPYSGTNGIPAGASARGSLLASVASLHGQAALRHALADRSGSVGERLARAAGLSVDSLVLEWRRWALSGGWAQHVRAGLGDVAAALLAASLLVFLATRSGRWH